MSAETEQLTGDRAKHIVQFYDRDEELADSVSGYLAAALEAGETAIVVATAAHRRAFEARMAATSDVAAAQDRGNLIALDAVEMMNLVLIGPRPDPYSLELIIGGLIRQALADTPAVRVYGEMVALLWDAGHVNGAIELEKLWNDLGQRLLISSWCGYPARSVSGGEHADALREICSLHTAVIGAPPLP
jgi:hypothetical protein